MYKHAESWSHSAAGSVRLKVIYEGEVSSPSLICDFARSRTYVVLKKSLTGDSTERPTVTELIPTMLGELKPLE